MQEKVVLVVGSNQIPGFYVVDFSNAPGEIPPPVQVSTSSTGGCVVDCSEKLAAMGNCTGASITIYDISTPAAPRAIGNTPVLSSVIDRPGYTPASSDFQGIGSISFYGGCVLAGEAGGSARVALIDISNLANPLVYGTGLGTVTGVAIFGEHAIISGTVGSYNAFQVAKLAVNPVKLTLGATTSFGSNRNAFGAPPYTLPILVLCDFDGTHAAFSDERGPYVSKFSNGTLSTPPNAGGTGPQAISIAETAAGYQLAMAATSEALNLNGQFVGEPAFESGWAVKFSRSITGTSTQLGAVCVTGGGGQYVAAYFSQPAGSAWTEQGQAPVALAPPIPSPNGPTPPGFTNITVGIATYYIFPPIPPNPTPIKRPGL